MVAAAPLPAAAAPGRAAARVAFPAVGSAVDPEHAYKGNPLGLQPIATATGPEPICVLATLLGITFELMLY